MTIHFCGEDNVSRAVAERLIADFTSLGGVQLGGVQGGWSAIKANFKKYCELSRHSPVFVTVDLDQHSCPPLLRNIWLSDAGLIEPLPERMLFCVAQREVESWLLADRDGIAEFLGVAVGRIDDDIENQVLHPKEYVIQLVQKSSKREVKFDILPAKGSQSKTGLGYNDRLTEFVKTSWQPLVAAGRSRSLERAINKLRALNS
jgi:hypothetical protein